MQISCPQDLTWLKFLDHELGMQETRELTEHLPACPRCRQSFRQVAVTAGWTAAVVDEWTASRLGGGSAAHRFLAWWGSPRGMAASAAAVALAVLAVPSTRGALADLVSSFQLRHVAAVSLTQNQIFQIENSLTQGGKVNIKQYGSINTTAAPPPPKTVALNQTAALTGLPQEWPSGLGGSNVSAQVTQPGRVVLTLNVSAINRLIQAEGGTHLFPKGLNHLPITLNMPTTVSINSYNSTTGAGYTLEEMGTPSLSTAGPVHAGQIAAAIASLPFLPSQVQQTLSAMQGHLQSTLIVPTSGPTSSVTVQGAPGIVALQGGQPAVAWERHGVFTWFSYQGSQSLSTSQFIREVQRWFP